MVIRSRRALPGAVAGAVVAAAVLTGAPTALGQGLGLRPCAGEPGLLCGTLAVPLDHRAPEGERLGLAVRVLPARGPQRGTVVLLAGGPGEAAIAPGAAFERTVAALAPGYRVVAFDQRGTGRTALRCPSIDALDAEASAAAVLAGCARDIGDRRTLYTTADSVADLETLRVRLGVPRVTLLGVSYGTLVATAYARTHPAAVRSLVLDSVVPPAGNVAVDADAYAASRRVLADLCAGGRCPDVTGDLTRDVSRLEAVLARRAVRGVRVAPTGTGRTAGFGGPGSPAELFQTLGAGDLDPAARGAFPGAVRAALRGDASALLRLERAGVAGDQPERFSIALLLATTCAESPLPWAPDQTVEQRTAVLLETFAAVPAGTFAPFRPPGPDGGIAPLCLGWPGAPSTSLPSGPLPDVPALLLVGTHDLRTPLESARRVRAELPRAQLVTVRGGGHSVLRTGPPCVGRAVGRFLGGRPATGACRGVDVRPAVAPVPPASLAALRPAGTTGRAGRVLQAARLTVRDAVGGVSFGRPDARGAVVRYEGLRGGRATLSVPRARITLAGYEYVPGVRVSGIVEAGETGVRARLIVAGPGAADGAVTVEDGRARGVAAGRRVDVPLVLTTR